MVKGSTEMLCKSVFHFRVGTALIITLIFGTLGAHAAAPMAKSQAPGYYRMMLGQFEVTALSDGSVNLDPKLLSNASQPEIEALLDRMFVDRSKMPASVNAYLINIGPKLVLVDAGGGKALGPALGNLLSNLKAAGYEPAQVDAVLLTHFHPDHVAGLVDAAGKPAFSNATVYLSKAESDYWLSTVDVEKAPPAFREHLEKAVKLVRGVAAPYIAAGKWKTVADGKQPVAGIKAILTAGHTPGHTAYEITSNGQSLLIIGDIVHSMVVQFARPDVAVSFDVDSKQAVAARQALFKRAAEGKTLLAGMHLPFPGIGHIRADGKETYAWVPIEYSAVRKEQK
jgi:glyoxylase-like metal-dependent hydrolase (beta-lactamase superfamily II)